MALFRWTDEDERELERLSQRFDMRERLSGLPARDLMPANKWDEIVAFLQSQLRHSLRAALIIKSLQDGVPALFEERGHSAIYELYGTLVEAIKSDFYEYCGYSDWLSYEAAIELENLQYGVRLEAVSTVLGIDYSERGAE